MQETFEIGIVAKPQGIRGELKITPYTDDVKRFNKLKSVIIDGKTYTVTNYRACSDYAIISILGVNDRNTAELFRGKSLRVLREDAIKPEDGSYFIVDIIGSTLIADDKVIGKIVDVTSLKTDVFTVLTTSGKIMRFPFLKDAVENVDVENSIVKVNAKRLQEIACYED
ncbi:MAG: 16S rRNA processing protein RimM [Clostridia bacterium]|nr:16S rRNA processing protein RimM [Clostridia bacterium]